MQRSTLDSRIQLGFSVALIVGSMLFLFLSVMQFARTEQQKNDRDKLRMHDVSVISQALEAYYQDHHVYPLSLGFGTYSLCAPQGCPTKTYLKSIPQDPTTGQTYQYLPMRDRQEYALYTCLEKSEKNGDYTISCNCEGSTNCKYKLQGRQHTN